jgi:lipopolysaccharide transport system ATP-binding protein
MSKPIIEVRNLSKSYRLGGVGARSFRDEVERIWSRFRRVQSAADSAIGHADSTSSEFWALRDVSFEVKPGEVLGIVGKNGAGKSSLLKILSRITEPSSGEVILRGRIASLLEVGTGFHPELSGRENIYLNGAILGMKRWEIQRKLDEIVAFAEVEQFLDTPVKRYSSGMYVRLAFAVAAHLEPEILILDEVLSVGDASFQRKCLGKMGEVSREGRTILFVSHNVVALQSLCTRAVHLEKGALKMEGPVSQVISSYLKINSEIESERFWSDPNKAPGNDEVRITRISISAAESSGDGLITMQTPVNVSVDYIRLKPGGQVHFTFHLINEFEVVVLTTSPGECMPEPATYQAFCTVPGSLLNSGGYRLRLLVVEDGSRVTSIEESIASFSVVDTRVREGGWMGREPSAVQVRLPWAVCKRGL